MKCQCQILKSEPLNCKNHRELLIFKARNNKNNFNKIYQNNQLKTTTKNFNVKTGFKVDHIKDEILEFYIKSSYNLAN